MKKFIILSILISLIFLAWSSTRQIFQGYTREISHFSEFKRSIKGVEFYVVGATYKAKVPFILVNTGSPSPGYEKFEEDTYAIIPMFNPEIDGQYYRGKYNGSSIIAYFPAGTKLTIKRIVGVYPQVCMLCEYHQSANRTLAIASIAADDYQNYAAAITPYSRVNYRNKDFLHGAMISIVDPAFLEK